MAIIQQIFSKCEPNIDAPLSDIYFAQIDQYRLQLNAIKSQLINVVSHINNQGGFSLVDYQAFSDICSLFNDPIILKTNSSMKDIFDQILMFFGVDMHKMLRTIKQSKLNEVTLERMSETLRQVTRV